MVFVGEIEFKRQGRYAEAEQLLEQMVAIYEEWHDPVQANGYRQQLEDLRKLMKSESADMVNVGDFPTGMFARMVGIDHWMIRFDAKESFTISLNNNEVVEGAYKVVKDEIELSDEMGPGAEKGNRKTGTYKWKLAEKKLTLTKIRDEADPRAAILTSGPWEMKE